MNKEIAKSLKEIKEGKATITMSLITYWALLEKAKKEVFDDIEKWAIKFYGENWYDDNALGDIKALRRLRKKHLNTSNTDEVVK